MRLFMRCLLLCGIAFVAAAPAQAQWLGGVFEHCKQVFHNNNAWPKPFVFTDRAAVAQPMLIMANNGWRRQNLLCAYHFDEDSEKLTPAGELKLRWILSQANPERRTVFLQRTLKPEMTALRMDYVQQAAVRMLPRGELPQVVETNMETPDFPADEVNNTIVQFNSSAPVPRLGTRSSTASSGSASSGGSGGGGSSSSGR